MRCGAIDEGNDTALAHCPVKKLGFTLRGRSSCSWKVRPGDTAHYCARRERRQPGLADWTQAPRRPVYAGLPAVL